MPGWARWLVRLAAATGASVILVCPRAESAGWSLGTSAAMIAALAGAMIWVWTAIEIQTRDELGPQLALCLLALVGASSLALVFSAAASTAQLAGLLAAGLAAAFIAV